MDEIRVTKYQLASGRVPFDDWVAGIDRTSRHAIQARIARLRVGNFGDSKRLTNANEVYELRIRLGPGYRIYYAKEGDQIVILLCGGDKGTQRRDIERAIRYWEDYEENNLMIGEYDGKQKSRL